MSAYDLDARFRAGAGPALLTGVQAIARLLVEQRALDLRAGRDVAAFISGYQGSPLGGLDKMLAGMPDVLADNAIHFQPAVNEELAATAVWGSQSELPGGYAGRDGVVGFWYGKGPGVDRASDALRHMAMYGVHPRGGVVLLVGDDPAAKSSTVPAVSERSLAALGIPVLLPRNAAEVITFGLHAVALSRACGTPVALKIVADVADGAWVVDEAVSQVAPITPTLTWEGRPWSYVQSPPVVGSSRVVAVEAGFVGPRAAMVQAYAAANALDTVRLRAPGATLGLIATGPADDSLAQALLDLGVNDGVLAEEGVSALRVGLIHPLDAASVRDFARGLDEILVVEDKTAFLEAQVRDALYDLEHRPRVLGKKDRDGQPLIPADGELTAGRLIDPLRRVLADRLHLRPRSRADGGEPSERPQLPLLPISRTPYFCSGCPHNRSTVVPEGSLAGGGIGCHTLVTLSRRTDSQVTGFTQMGGEGAQWIGQAPFTETAHLFQNLGDGTFFHSGQLAIQACVAAGVNITYKLLHNNVVAMTGAQDAEGARGIPEITHKLIAEGVAKIIVVSDEPGRHRAKDLAAGTMVWHRDRLDEAQRILRDVPGVTVLIYDQHCANDARRQRKRGTLPTRSTRVIINEDVCEGCGDCGLKSNCLSVQPHLTEFGEKTRIDQTSCNTDYSCLDGDCPAFMTVEVGHARSRAADRPTPPPLPDPDWPPPSGTQSVVLTGVGGTGIVTVNQVLATAALRAGYAVSLLDQIGLAQKAGPVIGHLRFAVDGPLEPSNRVSPGHADALLAFDLLTAVEPANLRFGDPERTVAVVSTSLTPTGPEVYDRSLQQTSLPTQLERLGTAVATTHTVDMMAACDALLGSTTAANLLLVGAAVQLGALRLPPAAVEEALAINGVAVAANIAAFRWGRVSVAMPDEFAAAVRSSAGATDAGTSTPATPAVSSGPMTVLAHAGSGPLASSLAAASFDGETRRLATLRAHDLVDFADLACAQDYLRIVDAVWRAEREVTEQTRLSEEVARHLYKLTAYKDEYEVARLLTRPRSAALAEAALPGATGLTFRLHPPMLRALGWSRKIGFAPTTHAALRALAAMKSLRGTALDPFGRARVRVVERELLHHYRVTLHGLVGELSADTYERAVTFAALPDLVRGYEDIKLASVDRYAVRLAELGLPRPQL